MRVAIIGASRDRDKFGNKAVRAYKMKGHEVFAVNPNAQEIEGVKCYSSILDVKEKLDRVSVYLPPEIGIKTADEIAKKKPAEVYLNPGTESKEIVEKLKKAGIKTISSCSIRAIGIDPSTI